MTKRIMEAESQLVTAKVDLVSDDGVLRESALTLGTPRADRVSVNSELPSDVWVRCREWYEHIESLWNLPREDGRKYWQRNHHGLEAEMAALIGQSVLPDTLRRHLMVYLQKLSTCVVLVELCLDDEKLESLPLELLGAQDWAPGVEIVVWRSRRAPILRRPELRLLAVRSAPKDVPMPQNEEEVAAIQNYVVRGGAKEISFTKLGNSTHDEFIEEMTRFLPGVVHLAMHGTRECFQFNSPPSNDLVKFDSMARYLGRRGTVNTVVSTACYSAKPTHYLDKEGVCFAREVVDQGISAAIGMANKITPRAAEVFCKIFYGELGASNPAVLAYARAVLGIKEMRDYDRLLWSVPIMYAKNSNVIPFPRAGYYEILDRIQTVFDRVEGVLDLLEKIPSVPYSRRADEHMDLSFDVADLLEELHELGQMDLSGTLDTAIWRDQLRASCETLDWAVSGMAASLSEGDDVSQISSIMRVALQEVKGLVAVNYPVAATR